MACNDGTYIAVLTSINFRHNDKYGLSYLDAKQFERASGSLSSMRRERLISGETYGTLKRIFRHYYLNHSRVRNLIFNEPRLNAQAFIGKKNIRGFIFKRDGFKCLCCGYDKRLEIDHIIPVSKGGENKLSNLQTLCKSCNCIKKDRFKDYRNGGK